MDFLRRISRESRVRILRFCFVGGLGVGVNLVVTVLVRNLLVTVGEDLSVLNMAAFAGTVVSILTNFLLNDSWTWGDRKKGDRKGWFARLSKYYLTASAGAGIELGIFNLVVYFAGAEVYLWAKLVGIASATFINFTLMHFWVFRAQTGDSPGP